MRVQFGIAVLSICLLPTSLSANDGAPARLRNKTITVAWTSQRTVMTQKGEKQSPPFTQERTIYVSTAGNAFIKFNAAEMAPGDTTPAGGAREVHFAGGRLVALAQMGSSAGRMIISFDPSYSSCTVDLTFGRPAGESVQRISSVAFSGQRCAIRDGNAFAN